MIRSVVRMVQNTKGFFSYWDIMNMEIAEFNDVIMELRISESAERFDNMRIEKHAEAVG